MHDSTGWAPRRFMALAVVLAFHAAVIAMLLTTSRVGPASATSARSVELLYLPPVSIPKVRAENPAPRRVVGLKSRTIALPALDSPMLSAASASSSDGSGSGVDWAAEARRALQAYDIRQSQPANHHSISSDPVEEAWWPQGPHHAGDKFKTPSGDWIVWVSDNCYQVASPGLNSYVPGAVVAQTICPAPSAQAAQ
jgi:hypothetical protein